MIDTDTLRTIWAGRRLNKTKKENIIEAWRKNMVKCGKNIVNVIEDILHPVMLQLMNEVDVMLIPTNPVPGNVLSCKVLFQHWSNHTDGL